MVSSVDVVGKLGCSVKGILKHVQVFRNNMVVDKRSLLTEGSLISVFLFCQKFPTESVFGPMRMTGHMYVVI